jgi:nicotinamidase-related amidase
MSTSRRLDRTESLLLVIDVQEGLVKAMDPEIGRMISRNVQILTACCREMGIPILATEQYPRGLGRTVPEVREGLGPLPPVEKLSFSCFEAQDIHDQLARLAKKQIILAGIETHVCVLQTALDLIEKDFAVHVAADAVASRRKLDWNVGLQWMERMGAVITTTEIIAFQLLKKAGTEEFKRLSKLIR